MAFSIGINELKDVAALLACKTGYPFPEMPLSFLKRRINLFFEKNRIRNITHFTENIDNQEFIDTFLYQFVVDCTEMFRDPGFWRSLNHKVLPIVNKSKLPVWFPEASSGQELYSFLTINHLHNKNSSFEVHFSHPSTERLAEIALGKISDHNDELTESNFKRLELEDSLNDLIVTKEHHSFISQQLLNNVQGRKGWHLTTPNSHSYSLIMYRNNMLYTNKSLQEKIGAHLFQFLSPGGYLAIGVKESLPDYLLERMEVVDEQERIYKKPGILNGSSL